MLRDLLAGLAILKPGPNIIFEASRGVVCPYAEYVSSLDKAWLEAHNWCYDSDNGGWYYNPRLNEKDVAEFDRRAKELVNSFKTLDLNW